MSTENPLLLALDLTGTFAFALNGALTAVRVAHLDIIGVVTLGMITALGGGIVRDILIDYLPPATFSDWRYLAVAAGGSLLAFLLGRRLERLLAPITVLDAAGLSLFAVTGASKALDLGLGPAQAVILGAVTGVGGGTIRDVLTQRIPIVLRSELYAIPPWPEPPSPSSASASGATAFLPPSPPRRSVSSSACSASASTSTHLDHPETTATTRRRPGRRRSQPRA